MSTPAPAKCAARAPQLPPVTAAACAAEWIATRAEIIARFGFKLRAGEGNRIDIRSLAKVETLAEGDRLKMNPWCTLILPDGAQHFTTAEDRDAVLAALLNPAAITRHE